MWAGRIDVEIGIEIGIVVGIVAAVEETEDRGDDFRIVGEAVKDGWKYSSEVDLEVQNNKYPPVVADVAMHGDIGVSKKCRSCSNQVGVGRSTKNGERGVSYPSGSPDDLVAVKRTDGRDD